MFLNYWIKKKSFDTQEHKDIFSFILNDIFETALSSIHIVGTALRTTRIGMAVFPCTELWH